MKQTIDLQPSIAEQWAAIVDRVARENEEQDNPLRLPIGFFRSISASGNSLGCGFFCDRCKLFFSGNVPGEVRHCGRVDTFPTGLVGWFKHIFFKTYRMQPRYWQ